MENDQQPFEPDGFNSFEQFMAVYNGRHTYDDTEEWIENLDALLEIACQRAQQPFVPQRRINV